MKERELIKKIQSMWQESTYFKPWKGSDKITFKKKLTLTDGKVLPDPYVLKKDWEDDVKLLPGGGGDGGEVGAGGEVRWSEKLAFQKH